MYNFLNKIFKLEKNKTNIKTEIIAGVTTFFAMCYAIMLCPNLMTDSNGELSHIWNACFVGGIIAAVIATLLMAFVANKPFALATGIGLASFFCTSFVLPFLATGMATKGYKAGLAVVFLAGMVFLILSVTGLRKYITTNLPACLKTAIPAGIGLFIAFVGMQNCGMVVPGATIVSLPDFTAGPSVFLPVVVTILGFILICALSASHIKWLRGASIIIGIAVSTALYYIGSLIFRLPISFTSTSVGQSFSDFASTGLFGVFEGFKYMFADGILGNALNVIMLVLTFCIVDMFDTLGTLYGASAEAGMLDENGDPEGLGAEMLCDSIGTVAGAFTGTSTVTTYVESSAGVAAGGRTGLTSFVTAVLFFVCMFLAPVAQCIPACATAPALIYVGLLMCKNIVNIDFSDVRAGATGFMTFIMMIVTYSISNGIMIGAITYVLLTLFSGKYTKKDIVVTVIAVLGILKFAVPVSV